MAYRSSTGRREALIVQSDTSPFSSVFVAICIFSCFISFKICTYNHCYVELNHTFVITAYPTFKHILID